MKQHAKEKQIKQNFREKIEEQINNFLRDGEAKNLKFEPMNKYERSIVHDVAGMFKIYLYIYSKTRI